MRLAKQRNNSAEFHRRARAIKAARLQQGFSRKQIAERLGWSPVSIERIENARCEISQERLEKVYAAIGVSNEQVSLLQKDPDKAIAQTVAEAKKDKSVGRKPRRNHYKVVTKQVRVLAILRKQAGLSQLAASRQCGLAPSMIGHIELGRVEVSEKLLLRILGGLEAQRSLYEDLMAAPVLRDDVLEECSGLLEKLPDRLLESALQVLRAMGVQS